MDRSLPASINDNRSTVKEAPPLKGSQWLNDAETNLKLVGQMIDEASQDQEGYGDDAVRLALGGLKNVGHVANAPVIKQGLQVAGALPWAAGQGMGAVLEHGFGVDPRYGHIAGELGDIAVGGGALKIGSKLARKGIKGVRTAKGTLGSLLEGGITAHAGTGLIKGGADNTATSLRKLTDPELIKRLISEEQLKLDEFRKTAAGQAHLNKGYDLYNQQGNLKGLERGGDAGQYIVRKKNPFDYENKRGLSTVSQRIRDLEAAKRGITESVDIPAVERALGDQAHRLPEFIEKVAVDLRGVENKRTAFNRWLRSVGKAKGSGDASLGHIKALDNLGIHLADNIRFETLGRNASRQAVSDPPDRLLRALNIPVTWDDAVKQFLDPESVIRHPARILTPKDKYSVLYEGADFDTVLKNRQSINKTKNVGTLPANQRYADQHGLKIKKTKPTQWSELRKRNIPIDVKLYGQSEWKVGDAKVTWYPNKNNPLKGRGQIDILDQASNTNPKGVKALIKDFNDAIKEFPSGTKVELNPMWKDAKRRSIYENYVFKNNPNIKPNPDDTLGWIYTAP